MAKKKENFIEENEKDLKPKVRTTSKTVEIETIKEEKSINYKKNKNSTKRTFILNFNKYYKLG